MLKLLRASFLVACVALPSLASAQVTAIRAGRLIDPDTGTAAANQVILVENGRFTAVGGTVAIPAGAEVIDLSALTVLPGLVDAHNHLALTYKDEPESNIYYFTYVIGLDRPPRDPGRLERPPDALLRLHDRARHGQQRQLRRHGAARGDRAGMGARADYYVPPKTRGEVAIEFIETWKAAGIPNADILRAMTTNGYKVSETDKTRGPIKAGMAADLIAVTGNPLESIDALRTVLFVLKDGLVFKRDGVMTPEKFLHGGPVKGWRIR